MLNMNLVDIKNKLSVSEAIRVGAEQTLPFIAAKYNIRASESNYTFEKENGEIAYCALGGAFHALFSQYNGCKNSCCITVEMASTNISEYFSRDLPDLDNYINIVDLVTIIEKYEDLPRYQECMSKITSDLLYSEVDDCITLHAATIHLNDVLELDRKVIADIVQQLGY